MKHRLYAAAFMLVLLAGSRISFAQLSKLTPEAVDAHIAAIWGKNAYFSALLCRDNTSSHFTHTRNSVTVRSKRIIFDMMEGGRVEMYYPNFKKDDDRYEEASYTTSNRFKWDEQSNPVWVLKSDNYHKKNNFYYITPLDDYKASMGFLQEKDGSITIFWIPVVNKAAYEKAQTASKAKGSPSAYDLYDYDKIETDVLAPTEEQAKAANLEAKTKEMKALIQKSILEDDGKGDAEQAKQYANTRPEREGMKLPDLQKNMMEFGQQFWDNMAGEKNEALGLKGGKLKKIWCLSNDWEITKNDLGEILYRSIYAQAIVALPSGKCYLYTYHFKEDYAGGGNYSKLLKADWIEALSEDYKRLKQMPCENAK